MMKNIETKEDFEEFLQGVILAAQHNFEQHPEVMHVVLIPHKNGLETVPFSILESTAVKSFGASIYHARRGVYTYIAAIILKLEAQGYLEVSEAWTMNYSTSSGRDTQKALAAHEKIIDQHGSLEHAPGRLEILFIRGRWKEFSVMHTYKIGRRGKSKYLYDHDERWETSGEDGRAAVLDRAVDKVTGITRVKP